MSLVYSLRYYLLHYHPCRIKLYVACFIITILTKLSVDYRVFIQFILFGVNFFFPAEEEEVDDPGGITRATIEAT